MTYMCNASCYFCPAPFRDRDFVQSAFGSDPSVILKYINRIPFEGISFSGGECFLVYDRMRSWLEYFKKQRPDIYFWAYTNGINVTKKQMEGLKDSGLNELRFNIAATGYNDPYIMETISCAQEIFEHIAVEIPSIPEDFEMLKDILPVLEGSGVDYLNLHEYILVPGDPNSANAPQGRFIMNYEMNLEFHRQSLSNTEKIKKICGKNAYNIKVNNCSLSKKEHQMLGRRLIMGELLRKDHEKVTDEGFLETICLPGRSGVTPEDIMGKYHQIDKSLFIHPEMYVKDETDAWLLRIMPALSISDFPKVLEFIKI